MKALVPLLLCVGFLAAADHPEIHDDIDSRAQHFGDVSRKIWEFAEVGFVPGTPGHSWQAACAGSTIGQKGMIMAAKTLALTGADLLLDPKLEAARRDFNVRRGTRVAGEDRRLFATLALPPSTKT